MELAAPPAITGVFVLAADTVLIPLADMDEAERDRLGGAPGDVVLTRLTGRGRSKLVDPHTARLVARFREPNSIVAAVISESRSTGTDPEATLEHAYPMFEQLIGGGFLVPEDAPEARRVEAELAPGSTWRGFEVLRVIQLLDDVDVYEAHGPMGLVALKRARKGATGAGSALAHEAQMLRILDGHGAPRLILEFDSPAALAIQWCDGVDADRAAARLRALPAAQSRRALLDLCRSVAAAYSVIHGRGVVHGDVHPRNVMVAADGAVQLIDFGIACAATDSGPARRAGAGYFFEPEYARARLAGNPHLPVTAQGEQHIVGHLLYRLVTGRGYRDFPAGEEDAMRALATGTPESFEHWGLPPWDALERVLGRALACEAEDRYADMTALCAALDSVDVPVEPGARAPGECPGVEAALARVDPAGRLFAEPFPSAPRCSVTFGSAGVALFLQRVAAARDSPELLGWSKLWIEKAVRDAARCGDEAYFRPAAGLSPEVVGRCSVQHTATGLHAVRAMIARAMGDVVTERKAADSFARAALRDGPMDVAFGRAGLLLTWALLREDNPLTGAPDDLGPALADGLVADLAALPALPSAASFPFAGMAHGWAGVLYALLAWCEVSGANVPDEASDRLAELAALAEPAGAGVRWPIHIAGESRGRNHMRGWCNGSAGMVLLLVLAARTLGEPRYLELAERAGRDACAEADHVGHLCCGSAGQAYAALALHRATRGAQWLTFAERVAADYAEPDGVPDVFAYSLLKGPLGGQLLAAELETAPAEARMPLFELAGWA